MFFVYLCRNLKQKTLSMTAKITLLRSFILTFLMCVSSSIYALTFNTTKTDVSCNGEKTGSIVVSVSDAVGNCYYSLTADFALQQTSNKFENLGAGTYTVYVKDDNGIVGPDNITITEPTKLEISNTPTSASVCNNGSISIEANGGTAPYIYSLDDFATQQNNNSYSSLPAGTYTAYVKDANGCLVSTAVTVEDKKLSLVENPSTTAASCYDATDGKVTLSIGGGIFISDAAPYNIALNKDNVPYTDAVIAYTTAGSAVSVEITNLSGGVYSGTIEEASGCSIPFYFNISRPEKLEATFISKTDVLCNGGTTGEIKFNITKGTAPYTVTSTDVDFAGTITTLSGECFITNLAAGIYEFIITDANGCSVNTTQEIVNLTEELAYAPAVNNVTCAGGATGKIFGTATGGALPYTYTLVGESVSYEAINSTGTFTSLIKGTYIASVKDKNGCSVTIAEPLKISEPETLTVDPLKSKPAANVVCENEKNASVTFTVVGREEIVAESDTARYYSVKLFDITNQHELSETDFKYSNKFHPVITKNRVEKEPVLDENGEPTYNEEGEPITKNVTYKDTLWTEGCHEITKVQEVYEVSKKDYTEDMKGFDCNDKITVSGLGVGAYSIRFFKGECEFGETITFTVGFTGSLPTVNINEIGSFCDESEYTIVPTIKSTPGVSKYEWTLDGEVIGTQKDLVHTFVLEENNLPLQLSVTNRCGTTASNTALVQVNKRPTATIENIQNELCNTLQTGVSIALTGKGAFTYMLADSTEKTTTEVFVTEEIIPHTDTEFTLISLSDQNCAAIVEKDINKVEIVQPDILSVEPLDSKPAATVVCETDKTASVTFTIAGRTEIVAPTDTASYYTVKLFNISNQQEILETDYKYTNILHPVITYNRVEKEPVLDENGEPTYDENGEEITKEVAYKDTLWTEGCHELTKVQEVFEVSKKEYTEDMKGFDCNDKITLSGLGAGAYSISILKGDCEFTEPISFTVDIKGSLPTVSINEIGSFCDESEYTITPTIESNPGVTKYEWTLDGEVIGTTKDLVHTFVLEENERALKLDIANSCGSATSNTITVQVNQRPTAELQTSKDYLCKNQPTEVSIILTGERPFTYTLPDGTEKTVEDVFSVTEIIPARDTVFTLTTLKDANCEAIIAKDINTAETRIYPEPEYTMEIKVPDPLILGRSVIIKGTEGFEEYTLLYNNEELSAKGPSNTFSTKDFPYGISTNDFKMEFVDENGCKWTVEDTKTWESIIFPNIFTPNEDGVNDVFLADYDLKVYDRHGTLMYEGTSGWDGTHNGMPANPGVYLFTLFVHDAEGNLEVLKSTLTLER